MTITSHNEKKITEHPEQVEARFVSWVTAVLTRERKISDLQNLHRFLVGGKITINRHKAVHTFLDNMNLHMSQSTCFGTWIETRIDPKDDSGFQGPLQCIKENKWHSANRSHFEITTKTNACWLVYTGYDSTPGTVNAELFVGLCASGTLTVEKEKMKFVHFCTRLIFANLINSAKLQKLVFTKRLSNVCRLLAGPELRKLILTDQEKVWFTRISCVRKFAVLRCKEALGKTESFFTTEGAQHKWSFEYISGWQRKPSVSVDSPSKMRVHGASSDQFFVSLFRKMTAFPIVLELHLHLQCIQKFFFQTLFDFKRMVSHSISPKFSGKIPYVLSKPRICFLGSKDKTVLF